MASDYLFVMAYDLRSQIYDVNDCIASANSPIARINAGLSNFTDLLGISSSKLVLGGILFMVNLVDVVHVVDFLLV
jgi:Di-N-acetylchitobiase